MDPGQHVAAGCRPCGFVCGVREDVREPGGPGVGEIERDRVGQDRLECLGRFLRGVHGLQPQGFRRSDVHGQPFDVRGEPRALFGPHGQQPPKDARDDAGRDDAARERRIGRERVP